MRPLEEILRSRLRVDRDLIRAFANRHQIAELAVFGSALRDDFTPESDIDILFELLPGESMSIEKYLSMKDELESRFGRTVDLVQKHLVTNPVRRRVILGTCEVLYAA